MTDKVKFWIVSGELQAEFPDEYDPLEASIQKWEYVVEHINEIENDAGVETCGLCEKYSLCNFCPVMEQTGISCCRGTPYMTFHKDKSLENAQAELDFLKSLRK